MDDDEGAGAVAVGVGVLFGGAAVGGPAGMADAEGALDGVGAEDVGEVAEFAWGAAELEGVDDAVGGGAGDGDAGGVIAAVFEAGEAFHNDVDGGFGADVSNDSAHGIECSGWGAGGGVGLLGEMVWRGPPTPPCAKYSEVRVRCGPRHKSPISATWMCNVLGGLRMLSCSDRHGTFLLLSIKIAVPRRHCATIGSGP